MITVLSIVGATLLFGSGWASEQAAPEGPPSREGKLVDLSYPFSEETIYWPTAEGFQLKADAAGFTEKGYFYSANSFCGAEHGGTHLDAPVHFAQGMPSADEIALERLVAPGVLIDLAPQVGDRADYQIVPEDLKRWEQQYGRIPDAHILLLRTGWGRFYPDAEKYLGTRQKGSEAVPQLHFPGLHPDTARWLVRERNIASIGLDTASIDYGQSQLFESHQVLSGEGIPVFENVARLDRLPPTGFQVVALPMKIKGGSGGPLRIIAILP